MRGIQVFTNEEPRPFPRGDNHEIAKLMTNLNNVFSRTTGQISIKIGTYRLWVSGIQVCSNEGLCSLLRNCENTLL